MKNEPNPDYKDAPYEVYTVQIPPQRKPVNKIIKMTPGQKKLFLEWKERRPKVIQDMIEKYPPDRLYVLNPTKQFVTIYSYSEDGTITVIVSPEWNGPVLPRRVFGINPKDLEQYHEQG